MPTHYQTLVDAVPGNTLTLTIDANIQHWLESALSAAVAEHHVAERGVGIVMDVQTGAVLAMSCQPDYNPNTPRTLINKEVRDAVNALTGAERSAALQQASRRSGAIRPSAICMSRAVCSSSSRPRRRWIPVRARLPTTSPARAKSPWPVHGSTAQTGISMAARPSPMGWPSAATPALSKSGRGWARSASAIILRRLACGRPTGIDLPGEIKRSEYYTADRMGPVELASCSFGQSSKVSYLQMLTAVCAVVNGGRLMQPYVVAKITAPDATVIKEVQPTVKRQVISAETSATMCRLMEGVVTDGTGKYAALAGYRVGGKSGTSQKLDSANEGARIASFVSVAPIDAPRLAVLICLDEPHSWTTSGGALSGPVCAEVLEKALPYLG